MSVQNVLLANGNESFGHRLNLDLISEANLTFPHGNRKSEEHVMGVVGELASTVSLIEPAVSFPHFPVTVFLGLAYCCRPNCFPRNASKMLDFSFSCPGTSFHTCLFGKGNAVLKDEQKSFLDK